MEVVGSDYRSVGWVKRVEMDGIVLDRRPLRRDLWLAMSDIRARIGGWLVLDTPSDRVDITEAFIRPRMGERPSS